MFFAYTRPRYQVSAYRTIGPLVFIFFSFFVAILDLLHDVEAIHNLRKLLTAFDFFFQKYDRCIYATANCIFSGITHISQKILRCS